MTRPDIALDEDPDEALAVLQGRAKGSKEWAAICLEDAIRHGDYPVQTATDRAARRPPQAGSVFPVPAGPGDGMST